MARLLVVDDEEKIRLIIRKYAEMEGHQVTEAKDGIEAVSICALEDFDVIILDVMMPGMDGPEVFRRMQEDERTQGIPVFFMTAVTDRDRVLECMEMNPEEYLVKPVSSSKLLKKLSDLFEKES